MGQQWPHGDHPGVSLDCRGLPVARPPHDSLAGRCRVRTMPPPTRSPILPWSEVRVWIEDPAARSMCQLGRRRTIVALARWRAGDAASNLRMIDAAGVLVTDPADVDWNGFPPGFRDKRVVARTCPRLALPGTHDASGEDAGTSVATAAANLPGRLRVHERLGRHWHPTSLSSPHPFSPHVPLHQPFGR
jgi:hypothetical protein